MKKNIVWSMALAALVGAGCQDTEVENVMNEQEAAGILTATVEETGSSRAAFWGPDASKEKTGKFFWTVGDQLKVETKGFTVFYDGFFTLKSGALTGTGNFGYTKPMTKADLGDLAFYPGCGTVVYEDQTHFLYTYPAERTLTGKEMNNYYFDEDLLKEYEGQPDKMAKYVDNYKSLGIPMAGRIVDGKVKLYHVGGALLMELYLPKSSYDLTVSAYDGEMQPAGTFKTEFDVEPDKLVSATGHDGRPTFLLKNYYSEPAPAVIHLRNIASVDRLVSIPVPAGKYENGLRLTLTQIKMDNGKEVEKEVFTRIIPPFELKRGQLMNTFTPIDSEFVLQKKLTATTFEFVKTNTQYLTKDGVYIGGEVEHGKNPRIDFLPNGVPFICEYSVNGGKGTEKKFKLNSFGAYDDHEDLGVNTTGKKKFHSFKFFERLEGDVRGGLLAELMFIQNAE